jgi:pyridinium-3,5-bisthiocarboxylic acid mononucleotide nickel chelatase
MKTLYLDLFSGISGDMLIAALIDLGVAAGQLEDELKKLRLDGYHLHVSRGQKAGLEGVKFDVHLAGNHHHEEHGHAHDHTHSHSHAHSHEHGRTFAQIRQLIAESRLSEWVKQKAVAVFQRIAVAEGKIHGLPPDQVSFHEVGAVDSIIDITGACIALEMLGKPRIMASPVVDGTGWIDCAHGRLPIPAPATLAILGARGIAVSQCAEPNELVTPTGAALLAELVETVGPMRGLVAEKIGYGLGSRENETRPNVLRAVLAEARAEGDAPAAATAAHDWVTDTIAVLETNLDDINAEILGNFMDKALAAGALDVFHTPIQMKKNRPGVLLTVLCAEADADRFFEMLVRDTSTFGIRRYMAERRKLRREFVTVQTPHGALTVKVGRLDGQVLQAAPEFESCRKLAEQAKVPLKDIYEAAVRALPPSLLK